MKKEKECNIYFSITAFLLSKIVITDFVLAIHRLHRYTEVSISSTDLVESKMANIERNRCWWFFIKYCLFLFFIIKS